MAKFDAADIEDLEYDFTKFGGGKGVIVEPSTKKVNKFFGSMRDMMKNVKELRGIVENADVETEEGINAIEQALEGDAIGQMEELQDQTMVLVAELCGAERENTDRGPNTGEIIRQSGAPSLEDLEKLPYRVLLNFNQWLMGEIRPKATNAQPASSAGTKGGSRTT